MKKVKANEKKASAPKTKTPSKRVSGNDELPGYPKYPADEDIMNRADRVSMDPDGTVHADHPESKRLQPSHANQNRGQRDVNTVTKEDLRVLKREGKGVDDDDEVLQDRVYPVDFAGEDLDVPGAELDDKGELDGNEDEENNLYSLGGENHEDLEEDRSTV